MARETLNMMFVHSATKQLPNGNIITVTLGLNINDQQLYRWEWKTGSWVLEAKGEQVEKE